MRYIKERSRIPGPDVQLKCQAILDPISKSLAFFSQCLHLNIAIKMPAFLWEAFENQIVLLWRVGIENTKLKWRGNEWKKSRAWTRVDILDYNGRVIGECHVPQKVCLDITANFTLCIIYLKGFNGLFETFQIVK